MKTIMVLRSKERAGEYTKPEYNGGSRDKVWNYYASNSKPELERKALEIGLTDYWIDTIKL